VDQRAPLGGRIALLIETYRQFGRHIVEFEQAGEKRPSTARR